MNYLIFSFAASFLVTLFILPFWIIKARKTNLTGQDMHKVNKKQVAEMGGVVVLLGFLIGVLSYIAIRIFFFQTQTNVTPILAIFTAILIAGIIGIIDDILGWKMGLKQWQKPLLTLLVAAPIMAVNAGTRVMSIPFIGNIDLSIFYPLIIIPIFILVGTNGFNMLAGYNGLEAGMGMIILSTLAYFSWLNNSPWLTVVALCMVSTLAAFWLFNKYPAKIFPGDTLTYTVGALAAAIAIFANIEKIFLILFIPYIIQFFLKLRGRFKKESFARVKEDKTLIPRYKNIYGVENLTVKILNWLKIKTTEKRVVHTLYLLELCCVGLTFVL
jgi:UDP-N-acetylglucosamine--dolichyl-phosphate N-acetylglucosaminephosphotransferase